MKNESQRTMKLPPIANPLGAALQHLVHAPATAARAARSFILQKGIMPLLFVLAGSACGAATRYEAENAVLGPLGLYHDDANASGGKRVIKSNQMGTGDLITFTVNVSTRGIYQMAMCTCLQVRDTCVRVNGVDLSAPVSNTGTAVDGYVTNTVPVALNAGDNTIVFYNNLDWGPFWDYIELPDAPSGDFFTIVASAGAGGVISPAGNVPVAPEAGRTFTITANYGYRIADVAVDSVSNPDAIAAGSHTFTSVTENGHTIAATFAPLPGISGVVSGPGGALLNANVTLGTQPDGSAPLFITMTNAAGEYLMIPPDANATYYLTASKGGHVTSDVLTVVMTGSSVTGKDFSLAKSAGLDPLVVLDASTQNVGSLPSWTNTGTLAGTFDSIDATHAPSVVADIGGRKAVKFDQPEGDPSVTRQTLVATVPAPADITGNSDWTISADLYMASMAWNGSENSYACWAGRDQGGCRTAQFDYVNNLAYFHNGADRGFGTVPGAGVWNNVTITYDGTTEIVYINGVIDSTETRALNLQPGGMMMVGGAYWHNMRGEDQYWRFRDGAIAKLQIFDQALTASEVQTVAGVVTPVQYMIAASAAAGGTISPAGNVPVASGASLTFTITPDYGYRIDDVVADGTRHLGPVSSYAFDNVVANGSIAATFAPLPGISGVVSDPGGALSNAKVTLGTQPDGSAPLFITMTNAAGGYTVVPPDSNGTYYLIASKGGHVTSDNLTVVMTGSAVSGANFTLARSTGLDPLVDLDASTLNVGILTHWTNTGSMAGTFDSIDATHAPSVVANIGGRKAVRFDQPEGDPAVTRQTLVATVPAPAGITGNSDWTISADLYMANTEWNGSDNSYACWAGRDQGTGRTAQFDYVNNRAYTHYNVEGSFDTMPGAGVWNNITITYDGTTEIVYVNGVIDSAQTRALNLQPGGMMMVGGAYWRNMRGEDQYWRFRDGAIARLQIFDQALTASEVLAASDIVPTNPYDAWVAGPFAAWIAGFDFSTFTNPDLSPTGDPDGDGLTNQVECAYGLDPTVAEDFSNSLTRDRWENIDGNSVTDLTRNRARFLGDPDESVLVPGVNESGHGVNYASRYRGFITAPETGTYHFWIAGDNEAELWLADGSIKQTLNGLLPGAGNPLVALTNRFGKQRIASIEDPHLEQNYTLPLEFDKLPSQHSRPVELVAGQKYYIEVLHKQADLGDNVALAWQVPGHASEIIPASAFTGDPTEALDLDDDNLPDAYEMLFGLNPSDNGRTNARDGQYADWDGDGLTNLEEYQLGTNPKLADTDGDGLSDQLERDYYRTDPTVSNIITTSTYATIPPHNYASATGYWSRDASGSLTAIDRRGEITYDFTVARGDAGVFEVVLTGAAAGVLRPVEELPLVFSINGNRIGSVTLTSLNGASATISLLTPWLKAGDYTLTILHDNYRAARQLRIDSLIIRSLSGLDANGNQLPDWIEQRLAAENRLTRIPATSLTSPVCIEGVTGEGVVKEGTNRRIPGLALKVNGEHLAPVPSVDSSFYADVPLSETGPVTLTASFQSGALGESRDITWLPANLRDYKTLHIRKGDALRLDAWNNAGSPDATKTFTVTLDGTLLADTQGNTTHTSGQPFTVTFDTGGTHTLVTTYGNKPPNTTTLHVHHANFGPALSARAYFPRDWTPASLGDNLTVQADSRISLKEITAAGAPRSFRVSTFEAGERHVVARIPDDVPGAPSAIVDRGTVNSFYLAYIDETCDAKLVHTYTDGTRLMSGTIIAVGLPPDVYIRIKSLFQGTLFVNGADALWLTNADFDQNGIATIYFEWTGADSPKMCADVDLFTTPPVP